MGGSVSDDDDHGSQFSASETNSVPLILHESVHLMGIVEECVDLCLRNASCRKEIKLINSQCKRTGGSATNAPAVEKLDLSSSAVQMKSLLKKWEGLINRGLSGDLNLGLKALSFSVLILKFIQKIREEVLVHVEKAGNKSKDEATVAGINCCYISSYHLEEFTRLFCLVINLSLVEKPSQIPLLLHFYMDALDIILSGVGQNVVVSEFVIGDWLFLLCIPWLKKLGNTIPRCSASRGLNLLATANINYDTMLQRRCISFFRFEVFYSFQNVIRKVLEDVMILAKPNNTCYGMLKLISGSWWPVDLFRWTELFQYCSYVFSQRVYERSEDIAVALAEAIARLPCLYMYKCSRKRGYSSQDAIIMVPKWKECSVCEQTYQNRGLVGDSPKGRRRKLKAVNQKQLCLMMLELLKCRKTRVHLVLIRLLRALRLHAKVNLLTFTHLFLKIYNSANLAVQLKAADVYGYCTRQEKKIRRFRKITPTADSQPSYSSSENHTVDPEDCASSSKTSSKSRITKLKNDGTGDTGTEKRPNRIGGNKSQPGHAGEISSHPSSKIKELKRKNVDSVNSAHRKKTRFDVTSRNNGTSSSTSASGPYSEFKEPPSRILNETSENVSQSLGNQRESGRAISSNVIVPYCSQKDLLLRSKSSFVQKPPLGRFDAASLLYNEFLCRFYLNCDTTTPEDVRTWNSMVGFHLLYFSLARYVDGEVWMVEVFKYYLHMLAKLEMVNLIILCQRTCTLMARRANCKPWELFGRFRETISEEIRLICFDTFLGNNPPVNDENAIKACLAYFLRIRIVLDLNPGLMMSTFLRLVVKKCVVIMFQDRRAHTLLSAIGRFSGAKSIGEFLQLEFAYYYPYALLFSSQAEVSTLLQRLQGKYKFDPSVVMKMNPQFLHIEMLSNIFEYRENVLQNYNHFLQVDEDDSSSSAGKKHSRLVRAIGQSLERLYVGVVLYFESKFLSRAESIISKRKYLGCFATLMGLLGKRRVTSSKLKLYALLNSLRTMGPDFHDLLYQAWRAFCTNLEDDSLRQMSNQILAGISFLRDTRKSEVDSLCKLIFINQHAVLKDNVKHLHFLQYICDDPEVQVKLKDLRDDLRKPTPEGFFYQLVEELGHENSHIRYRAALTLERFLKECISDLQELWFEDQLFSRKTTLLLRNLLNASKSGTCDKVPELSASCIGFLGALDPRRFDLKAQLSENARFGLTIFTVGEIDFLKYFIEELTKALRASVDTRNFDSYAFSIQEVIKLYGIEQSEDNLIWPTLSPKAQDLMIPLLTSKYSRSESAPELTLPSPVYMTEFGSSLRRWLYHWSLKLMSVIKSDNIRTFFDTISASVDKSEQMGLVILPYVASYAIMEGEAEGANTFLEEISAVLSYWVANERVYTDATKPVLGDPLHGGSLVNSGIPGRNNAKMEQWKDLPYSENNSPAVDDGVGAQFPYAATQAVFKVLDHLQRLVRNPKHPLKRKKQETMPESQSQISERIAAARSLTAEASKPISEAQNKLRYDVLSLAAFECRNFARSLMYMEQHLQDFPVSFEECFGSLQRIYVALFDEDSVKGLESKRTKEITVMEDALNKLSLGKLEMCVPLFETILAEAPEELINHQQLVHAYLGLDKFDISDVLMRGCCSRRLEWSRSFDEAKLEISIKKGETEDLREQIRELSSEKLSSWGLTVSEAFLEYRRGNLELSKEALRKSKLDLLTDICNGAAFLDMEFYFRHYQDFMRLQLLTEFEEIQELVSQKSAAPAMKLFDNMKANWERRLKCAYKSMENFQTIISFRKCLLHMTKEFFLDDQDMTAALNSGLKDCFVKLAKMETSLGNFSRAEQLFTECKLSSKLNVYYEEGKMLFQARKYDQSIKVLEMGMKQREREVERFRALPASAEVPEEQARFAKAYLIYAIQKDEQRKVDLNFNIENYKFAIAMNKRSEKNYFYMALYYDRLWSQAEERDKQTQAQILMVQNYGASLTCGCNFIYQSLPRLLTIWFDYAAQIHGLSGAPKASSSPPADPRIVMQLTDCIRELVLTAPTYIFIVAFSQLISRLAHVNTVVYNQLKEVLAHMITVHPDQVLWMILSVLKSTYPRRVQRCHEILKLVEQKQPSLRNSIRNYKALGDKLIQFTMKKSENSRFVKVSEILPALPKLIRNVEFSNVLMPFETFMRPALPRGGKYVQSHQPFPEQLVYISDILEPVQVMASLQKPKKITLVGSNGKAYSILCKPSDDLRKDGKVMEINNMVQWHMSRDKESRKRNLIVRTYTVTPLSDTCGILEWISNLHGYRPLITSLYKDGVGFAPGQHRNFRIQFCDRKDSLAKKRQMFVDLFMANHPIVMSYWFLKAFHDPQSWYMARTSFVKTSAVMSIIGFLMGLGDRHGENLLLDSSNGDVVHVDFNCLFNKGETFDWPERVPFRLTRNMINGMGPLGYEGMFRCCCEIVMRLIRNHSSVFLSIIRPFVFDPLLEWEAHIQLHTKQAQVGECNNPKAVEHLNNIRDRLLGSARNMTKERNVALSVEAHVNYLIKESVKLDNLCQMYIGWAGYL